MCALAGYSGAIVNMKSQLQLYRLTIFTKFSMLNLIETDFCVDHLIYYQGDKKYPTLRGIGLIVKISYGVLTFFIIKISP